MVAVVVGVVVMVMGSITFRRRLLITHHARHHDEHDREDMELELENEDSNVARMFYHH